MPKLEKIVIIPDLHCGDEDRRAIDLACKVTEAVKPDRLIFLGDILDSGWASAFPQNKMEIKGMVKKEKDIWRVVAEEVISAAPTCSRFQMVPGNHDWRIVKGFAWSHPEFYGDEIVSLPHCLKAEELGIEFVSDPAAIFLASKRFVVTHGVRVRKHSGASAMAELCEEWWCSGISGHTHRMGQVYRTVHSGIYCWTEGGHLMNREPKYKQINKVAPMNWQQGISVMFADQYSYRNPDLIPFWTKKGKLRARYQEKEFTT